MAEWLDHVEVVESEQIKAMVDEIGEGGVCTWWMTHTFYKYFWVLPELKMLTSRMDESKFVGFHLTGKLHDIVPIMLETEPDFTLRFESPRFGGDCSFGEAKARWGDKVCLMGGYDPHILTLGSRADMLDEARRCIDEAAAGGGYILANTDAIPEGTELEDVRAMVDFVKACGSY